MHPTIHPSTHLDIVRADAAARQRRAAEYRTPRTAVSTTRRRSTTAALLATAAFALATLTTVPTAIADEGALPHGYEQGQPDGWYEPGGIVVATGDVEDAPSSTLRSGYAPGHADGWFDAEEPTVRVAGVVLTSSESFVPRNVR